MAFVCTIRDPMELVVLEGQNEVIARSAIGYDDATRHVYSAFVALSPVVGNPRVLELVFNITEADVSGDDYRVFWDGLDTKLVVSDRATRDNVLSVICTLISDAVAARRPEAITLITHEPNLPAVAMRKYDCICAILRQSGYTVGRADPYKGQCIWMAELS